MPTRDAAHAPSRVDSPRAEAKHPDADSPGRDGPSSHALLGLQGVLGNRAVARMTGRRTRPDVLGTAAAGLAGAGGRLPHLERLQRAFAPHDLGHIRAHADVGAGRAALAIGARAYALGDRIAFADEHPGLDVVAHEVTHTLQQRGGLRLKDAVGAPGDRHERQADAIAAAVVRGDVVGPLLGPAAPRRATTPAVQRLSVDARTAKAIRARIKARGGEAVEVDIDDRFYSFESDKGLAAVGVASMADDPHFEAEAERFEARVGSLAYNHRDARAAAQAASTKILRYIDAKYELAVDRLARVEGELAAFGMDNPGWSGAVGKSAAAIRNVLTRGALGEQVAHVESFVCNVLNVDLMEDRPGWRALATDADFDVAELDAARLRVAGTGDRYLAYDLPDAGASARQWHTRIGVSRARHEADLDKLPLHPSSVQQRGLDTASSGVTTRKKQQVEAAFPVGLGVHLGADEAAFQEQRSGSRDHLLWEEGARVWALNELDSWVHAQREFSLPLSAGTSSTAARIMQAFKFLGVGPPDDCRLAAIGALLPPRHHTLVEVMFAASHFGATPYREGPMMYHDLAPLTDEEVRAVAKFYPDETIEADPLPQPDDQVDAPQVQPDLQAAPPRRQNPPARARVDPEQQALQDMAVRVQAAQPHVAPTFTRTRASLSLAGISNTFKTRNSAQARMLRAIDTYHALPARDEMGRLRALAAVRDEAAHWLSKHGSKWSVHWASTQRLFGQIRDEAAAVIAYYENNYMLDLGGDRMLADAHHAFQGLEQIENAGGRHPTEAGKLIRDHGLTEAECAAIAAYVGPSYKFINPGLEQDSDRMMGRLMGFVSETANSFSESRPKNAEAAAKARRKLRALRNKKQGAMDEAYRHAVVATLGLSKLPPYTGMVYAGGALTRKDALDRFQTGEVQSRAAFASTTREKMTANMFAATKWSDVNAEYQQNPTPDKAPFAYVLTFRSRTGRCIELLSHKPEEKEVLFAPGSKLRIVRGAADARQDPDNRKFNIIDAEEVT